MRFITPLDVPAGMTHDLAERMFADFEGALDDGSFAANDFIMRGMIRRGLADTPSKAREFTDYIQNLAARIRMERGLAVPGTVQSRPSKRRRGGRRLAAAAREG